MFGITRGNCISILLLLYCVTGTERHFDLFLVWFELFISFYDNISVSILYKSIAGRYRPVRVADGPITARYRFIKNASWDVSKPANNYRVTKKMIWRNSLSLQSPFPHTWTHRSTTWHKKTMSCKHVLLVITYR